MASQLKQLSSKACQATQFVTKHGNVYYKQLMEQNKQYVQDPPTVEKCNLLAKQLLYTRLASQIMFPFMRLRLMVYSLVTTSSFLTFALSLIFNLLRSTCKPNFHRINQTRNQGMNEIG